MPTLRIQIGGRYGLRFTSFVGWSWWWWRKELVVERAGDWLEDEGRKIVKECGVELEWWEDSVSI